MDLQELINQAESFLQAKDFSKALDLYDLILAKQPDHPHVRYCVASMYSELGKTGLAISMLRAVTREMPEHAQAWNNLGISYKNSGQWESAKEAYEKSLTLNYEASTLINMSGLYINNGTPDEAIKWAKRGLKLAPESPMLHNHMNLAHLEQGNFREGFKNYDIREQLPAWSPRKYDGPKWKGEYVDRLVIHGEQGLGDEILFMNALDRVKSRVGEVIIECATRWVPVFERSLGVRCFPDEKSLKAEFPTCDAWIPMGSLFGIVGYDEHKGRYLNSGYTYPKSDKFRIGISWRGGTVQTHESLRNFNVDWWRPLIDVDAEVISVQYGPAAGMAQKLGIKHDQEWIDDLDKMMGLIESCDLIITVTNTTVHQAAALGVPVWVLVPSKPSWQFQLSGDKMPWYQTPKLFRQAPGEDWRDVVNRVRINLVDLGIVSGTEQAVA